MANAPGFATHAVLAASMATFSFGSSDGTQRVPVGTAARRLFCLRNAQAVGQRRRFLRATGGRPRAFFCERGRNPCHRAGHPRHERPDARLASATAGRRCYRQPGAGCRASCPFRDRTAARSVIVNSRDDQELLSTDRCHLAAGSDGYMIHERLSSTD